MIKAHELKKIFTDKKRGEIVAVNKVSFEVHPGEIFGLLGLNGAGKTTTLRLLAGLLRPNSGTCYICNINVAAEPEKAKARLGFLTGTTGLYGRLTAAEMIKYFGRLYGLDENSVKKRANELMEILSMTEFANTRCDKLSSGTKQKVSIARTMIHDPDVIILDEPTAGLDVISSRAVIEFVSTEKARSKTIIFSTHIMHEAEKLCDRIGIIDKGRIAAVGTPSELKAATACVDMDDAFVKLVGNTYE
ncbi:MAG: ATP-binding cassette domain-containing protein [candidate division Zixibacteria bacterium]|nr:ATP-binding cassette domain-containing protein [candidate division Zixibacteria bacterium]